MLEEKLNKDLVTALKAKDAVKLSVIRMLKADITNACIKQKKDKLADDEILKIIQTHVKRHNESIEQFKKGSRPDLVEKEDLELVILKTYVPEQMPDSELESLVKSVIQELGAKDKKDMGKVIKSVLEKASEKADGKRVSALVGRLLAG